jgi:TfoX/Sxy family transcriptional regulator of competence genes
MATELDFIEYVCDQINDVVVTRHKKMFGEYMVYVNDKPILLVCDNTVYVKIGFFYSFAYIICHACSFVSIFVLV